MEYECPLRLRKVVDVFQEHVVSREIKKIFDNSVNTDLQK